MRALFAVVSLALAGSAGAGVPLGPPFQVDTLAPTVFEKPRVAVAPDGRFAIAWSAGASLGSDASGQSVQARVYDASGAPLGPQFQVNTTTSGDQEHVDVDMDAAGNFVVVWSSDSSAGSDASGLSVQGQRFDATGAPLGGEFQVNTLTTGNQWPTALSVAPDGAFIVSWRSHFPGDYLRRYDTAGAPLGVEFAVPSGGGASDVALDPSGRFVVAWFDWPLEDVLAQRFDATGAPSGGPITVAVSTEPDVVNVASAASGDFLVSWNPGIFGRRYFVDGTAKGPAAILGSVAFHEISVDPSGNAVLVGASGGDDASAIEFDKRGRAVGDPFEVTDDDDVAVFFSPGPHVDQADDGGFVVVYSAWNGANFWIRARRFAASPRPAPSVGALGALALAAALAGGGLRAARTARGSADRCAAPFGHQAPSRATRNRST